MHSAAALATAATHQVFNQAKALENYNLFDGNQGLQSALKFNAPGLDTADLQALGARLGSAEMQTHAQLANVHTPQLRSHDRYGNRVDVVDFHPSYHALMAEATRAGLHGSPWPTFLTRSPARRPRTSAARRGF